MLNVQTDFVGVFGGHELLAQPLIYFEISLSTSDTVREAKLILVDNRPKNIDIVRFES